jgi:sugar phosphate permease
MRSRLLCFISETNRDNKPEIETHSILSPIGMWPKKPSAPTQVLILICVMYGLTYIDRVNVSSAASSFQVELHLTNAQVGLIFSVFAYPYLLFQIIGGRVSDRFGARLTLAVSAIIWASATLLMGFADNLFTILFARILLGLGEGATFPAATRAMSDWVSKENRGFAQGITHASARLGNALTPPLVVSLMVVMTWRGSFIILGIVSMAWAVLWLCYFRDDPSNHSGITQTDLQSLTPYVMKKNRLARVPWHLLISRMLPVTVVYFCYGWTLWLYLAWIPSFFVRNYHLDLKRSALFSAGVFFAGVVGDAFGGILSDKIFLMTGNLNLARRDLIIFSLLSSLLFMLPIVFLHNLTGIAIFLSLAFFCAELTSGPIWAIPMDIAPEYSGAASGLMNIGSALAAIVSPLVFGYVIDKTNNWEIPFRGSIVLLFCGAIAAFWIKPLDKLPPRPRIHHA